MSLIYIKDDKFFKLDENIEIIESVHKEDIITASLSIKDIITYTFKLPLSTSEEEITSQAEIEFYEKAGVDPNKQYIIHTLTRELKNEDVYLIEIIAASEDTLKAKFDNLLEKVHYIDFISIDILAFSEFYELYQKEPKRDAFVYLDNNKSFISVYENGEYLYSKTLNSLSGLLKTIDMDYDEFVKIISTKGVNKENYDTEQFLIAGEIDKFFSEYFMAINNRISYGRSIFYLENIDNIYFYTPFEIEGIDSLKTFWDLSGINFEKISIEKINFLDNLVIHYNKKHYQDGINFSIFPRPPKFYKTKTFQLGLVVFATIAIFGADFGYRYYQNQVLKNKIHQIKKQIKIKKARLTKLKAINKLILDQLAKYNKEINDIESKIKTIKTILTSALNLSEVDKTNQDFILISNLLKKNKLQTFLISKDENKTFNIGVFAEFKNREYIGNFMNDLSKHNYQDIRTDKIYTIGSNYYMSLVRFKK